jgi:hypothetical protein
MVMKSRRIRWTGHVAGMGKMRNANILFRKPKWKRPLGRPRHRWENILKWIFKEWDMKMWAGFIWFRVGSVAGCCEHNNESFGSIKDGA